MIEFIEAPGHLVAMKISGELTGADVERVYGFLKTALDSHDKVSFFADVDDSLEFTLDGLIKDVTHGLGQLGMLSRYHRAALVTDKKWLAALARFEGLIFAWMEIRVFPRTERDAAFAWASETHSPSAAPTSAARALKFIPTTKPDVVAYEIDGRVTKSDIDEAISVMDKAFDGSQKLRVLGRITNLKGFDVSALVRQDLIAMKSTALKKVERYAVVGTPNWLRNFLELIDPMFKAEIRVFDAADEEKAWEWLEARPA